MPDHSLRQTDDPAEATVETPADSSGPVIELADLSTGADAEVNRLKSSLTTLSGEIDQIRGEHVNLASDYQKLTDELRDVKLVLAKVHAKELRAVEGHASWMQSLWELGERLQLTPYLRDKKKTKNPRSPLQK